MKKKLVLILNDRFSEIIDKGEIKERYYNPGDLFDEVNFVILNTEEFDHSKMKIMVGAAHMNIFKFSLGKGFFFKTLGWRPLLVKWFTAKILDKIESLNPDVIRTHGTFLNGFIAAEAKRKFKIPYVVSLHNHNDAGNHILKRYTKYMIIKRFSNAVSEIALKRADLVLPVYTSITSYLKRLNIHNYKVIYNSVSMGITKKTDYSIAEPVRLLSVGRQIHGKNVTYILEALKRLIDDGMRLQLTIVGTGDKYQDMLDYSQTLGLQAVVQFIPKIENKTLCQSLHAYDIFLEYSVYPEISKALLEALQAGLPCIKNEMKMYDCQEIDSRYLYTVQGDSDGYYQALTELIRNSTKRETLGIQAKDYAKKKFDPSLMEKEYVNAYQRVIAAKNERS